MHLAHVRGKEVILSPGQDFYPTDNTPGCTVEACSFRDAWPELTAVGVES